jgi:hypothetical protein
MDIQSTELRMTICPIWPGILFSVRCLCSASTRILCGRTRKFVLVYCRAENLYPTSFWATVNLHIRTVLCIRLTGNCSGLLPRVMVVAVPVLASASVPHLRYRSPKPLSITLHHAIKYPPHPLTPLNPHR